MAGAINVFNMGSATAALEAESDLRHVVLNGEGGNPHYDTATTMNQENLQNLGGAHAYLGPDTAPRRPMDNNTKRKLAELEVDNTITPSTRRAAIRLLFQQERTRQAGLYRDLIHDPARQIITSLGGEITNQNAVGMRIAEYMEGAGRFGIGIAEHAGHGEIQETIETALQRRLTQYKYLNLVQEDVGNPQYSRLPASKAVPMNDLSRIVVDVYGTFLAQPLADPLADPYERATSQTIAARFFYNRVLLARLAERLRSHVARRTLRMGMSCTVILRDTATNRQLERRIISPSALYLQNGLQHGTMRDTYAHLLVHIRAMLNRLSEDDLGRSGLVLQGVASVEMCIGNTGMAGVSGWIKTPDELNRKHCVLNVHNLDEKCAFYAFTLGYMIATGRNVGGSTQYINSSTHYYREGAHLAEIDWSGIEFPMLPAAWDKFERKNPHVGVFIYEYVNDQKFNNGDQMVVTNRIPIHANRQAKTFVYLLLLSHESKEGVITQHYTTIRTASNLGRLFNMSGGGNHVVCPMCINKVRPEKYDAHVKHCSDICEAQCTFPSPNTVMSFKNVHHAIPLPVIFLCDFECRMENTLVTDEVSGEQVIQKIHIPVSYALHVHSHYEGADAPQTVLSHAHGYFPTIMYTSSDPQEVVSHLLLNVERYSTMAQEAYTFKSPENIHRHYRSRSQGMCRNTEVPCVLCEELLNTYPPDGVIDEFIERARKEEKVNQFTAEQKEALRETTRLHPMAMVDHIDGAVMGFAHNACFEKMNADRSSKSLRIPLYFHNATGYDMKIILRYIGGSHVDSLDKNFCIVQTDERVKQFDVCGVQIVDSMAHLSSSIDGLTKSITENGTKLGVCEILRKGITRRYPNADPQAWQLLCRKGVFPYAWFDNYEKMRDSQLPPPECFRSDLDDSTISQEEYEYAQQVWTAFGCRTFGDYHDVYLLTDVLLLADNMNMYRTSMLKSYKLDPARYSSISAFAFDAMLRCSKVQLDLMSDSDMYMFAERAMRGGISIAVHPYAKAENKYTRQYENRESEPGAEQPGDSFIAYQDATALYGSIMCWALPVGGFDWKEEAEANDLGWMHTVLRSASAYDSVGYFMEVDLEIPEYLHEQFNDLPPAPEKMTVSVAALSDVQQAFMHTEDGVTCSTQKLVPHLMNKQNYVVHYRVLALYEQMGVKITRIHNALRFNQSTFMKSFSELNTTLRKEAQRRGDLYLVSLFKSMSNHVFGKCMEQQRNRGLWSVWKVDDSASPRLLDRLDRMIGNNNFKRFSIISKEVALIEKVRRRVVLDKPIIVGAAILDLSKLHMYNYWYNILQPRFGVDGLRLLYMDTDSFIFHIKSGDLHRDLHSLEVDRNWGSPICEAGQGLYDWSNLDRHLEPGLYSVVNEKQPLMFKDEMGSGVITEVVALRSKMYQVSVLDRLKQTVTDKRTAKGVPRGCRSALDFRTALKDHKKQHVQFTKITSHRMSICTEQLSKVSLSSCLLNDKRIIYEDVNGDGEQEFVSFAIGYKEHKV